MRSRAMDWLTRPIPLPLLRALFFAFIGAGLLIVVGLAVAQHGWLDGLLTFAAAACVSLWWTLRVERAKHVRY
ncbi:MAG: hypothetical protein AAF533_28960 [Acidobacteriota bacterium]